MLKKILENLEGLDAAISALYKKGADNKYHLDVEDDDHAELMRAKEHEVGLRRIAEQERDTAKSENAGLQQRVGELTRTQSTGVNELRTQLEQQYGDQITKLKDDHGKKVTSMEAVIKRVFVDNIADRIAAEISTVPELVAENLKKRLQVEMVEGEPITRVLTADGKPSVMTPDQLKVEYFTNKKYASIMRASDASGGGAANGLDGAVLPAKKLKDMGDTERSEWAQRDPAGFDRAVAVDKAASNSQ